MKRGCFPILALFAAALLVSGCEKEPPSAGVPGYTHIAVGVDSAFFQAPNVVTPNGDGINDAFMVSAYNMATLHTAVLRLNGDTAFGSTSTNPVWSNLDSTDLGRYYVHIVGTSLSGHELSGYGYLDILAYGTGPCLHFMGTPVTGDQFDPRIFGVSYPSNDIFCE